MGSLLGYEGKLRLSSAVARIRRKIQNISSLYYMMERNIQVLGRECVRKDGRR
jgi:hypothetical protein